MAATTKPPTEKQATPDSHILRQWLQRHGQASALLVGFSGGLDSTVLLHLLKDSGLPLRAVHINHGIAASAAAWARHCAAFCRHHQIPWQIIPVDGRPRRRRGPEASAREARYHAFQQCLQADEVLLLGHHMDDQAETCLLQLLRGGSPHGLAAMPDWRPFGDGYLGRPLLPWQRPQLHAYAQQHGLQWLEDDSNYRFQARRNVLRHQILPLLQQHWPNAPALLAAASKRQAESALLLDGLAQQDGLSKTPKITLDWPHMAVLPPLRQRHLLRSWVRHHGRLVPSDAALHAFLQSCHADCHKQPQLQWSDGILQRWQQRIYLLSQHAPTRPLCWRWQGADRCPPDAALGVLSRILPQLQIAQNACVELRLRHGGERFLDPAEDRCTTLKKWFLKHAVPPWERRSLPLLFVDGQLAAIADKAISPPFLSLSRKNGR